MTQREWFIKNPVWRSTDHEPRGERRPAGSNSPATRSSAGFAMLTRCIDLDSQEGDAIQRFTKSADNSAPICFPYCAWICLDSWVSFDLPLALLTPLRIGKRHGSGSQTPA